MIGGALARRSIRTLGRASPPFFLPFGEHTANALAHHIAMRGSAHSLGLASKYSGNLAAQLC